MKVTTARKPSQKTRTFCKRLSKFTGWEYITRGKSSLSSFDDGILLLVGESRGNPANFKFFLNGECFLSIRANVSIEQNIAPGQEPVIEGDSALAHALCNATGFIVKSHLFGTDKSIDATTEYRYRINNSHKAMVLNYNTGGNPDRFIRVSDERIEFIHKDVALIVLKVIGIRGKGFA